MSVQMVNQINVKHPNNVTQPAQNSISSGSSMQIITIEGNAPTHVKIGVALTTLAGVALAMARTFKVQGKEVKSVKDFLHHLVHIKYDKEKHEVEKLVGRLALGSVGGGLIGGALFDKPEHLKAKCRESVIQLVGNIATPLGCVLGGLALLEKTGKPAESKLGALVTAVSLVTGIFLGNKVGNEINQKAFKVDDKRKIKLSDMSPHIDDVCLAASLVASKGNCKFSEYASRFIPAALTIAGYSVGTTQERYDRVISFKEKKLAKANARANSKTKQSEPVA